MTSKTARRGFVMTGGGAKGLFEAGVIHAFHLCGMEFDVITGSSIGAINSVFYAEYLLRKRELSPEVLGDPHQTVEAMDPLVRAFLHAWWGMPSIGIIDESDDGSLVKLKDDLLRFDLCLPQLVQLIWWWTGPERWQVSNVRAAWPAGAPLIIEVIERLDRVPDLLEIFTPSDEKRFKDRVAVEFLRSYLSRFGMEKALVTDEVAQRLKTYFTGSLTPLTSHHLEGSNEDEAGAEKIQIIAADRTLRDFKVTEDGAPSIDVRLTRANFRTGRLEVSGYWTVDQFESFLKKHAWRYKDPQSVPLGSGRIHMVGNPNAIDAALASGRFPGVFAPMPITEIYDFEDSGEEENQLLAQLIGLNWSEGDFIRQVVEKAEDAPAAEEERFQKWKKTTLMSSLFPRPNDTYVDGGAIDNTPTNSAIDATKEWISEQGEGTGNRDVELELYTIFLHPVPDPQEELDEAPPLSVEVVSRTLELRSATKLTSDEANKDFVNNLAATAEDTGQDVLALVNALLELVDDNTAVSAAMSAAQRRDLADALENSLDPHLPGRKADSLRKRLEKWKEQHERKIDGLPLHVRYINIHPEAMPMSTLQFTKRLGYRPEKAIDMMTSGCYSTIWALRQYLEDKSEELEKRGDKLNDHDQRALDLARHWMSNVPVWPDDPEEQKCLRVKWQCRHTVCAFFQAHCCHGAKAIA